MNSPKPYLPAPRTYEDVPLVPAVDPEDLKRVWNVKPPWTATSHQEACSPGANVGAVRSRRHMINTLVTFKLLGPWTHDEQLDDAVFRVAATFPLHERQSNDYKIPGDELHPFDLNAFLQKLVEESGIACEWEPVQMKVPEGGRRLCIVSAHMRGAVPDPGRNAAPKARQVLWLVWSRFAGVDAIVSRQDVEGIRFSTALFANFLIKNADIVQRVEHAYRQEPWSVGMDLLREVEERASRAMWG